MITYGPGPTGLRNLQKMFHLFENVPVQEWIEPGQRVLTKDELGITGLQNLQEWASNYELPGL